MLHKSSGRRGGPFFKGPVLRDIQTSSHRKHCVERSSCESRFTRRIETNSERHTAHSQKTIPSLWLLLSPNVAQRDMLFKLSLFSPSCRACCVPVPHSEELPSYFVSLVPCSCSCLSEENRRSSSPRVASSCKLATRSPASLILPLLATSSAYHAMHRTDTWLD